MKAKETVHLGFEVGTGAPVEIPLAHTFVTGQTQNSGKTTTLRAIVERSRRKALAFITKRGENLPGRTIRPYLPREGDSPIPWRLVEKILAAALEQRSMRYERMWIVNATKGAKSLEQVRANATRLQETTKSRNTADAYMMIGEYLDLVLPEMAQLDASSELDLLPGLNVMDLSGCSTQVQALVIRASMERINKHESQVLTVLPEAWEFCPRGRSAPAKDEAIAMARKGAAPGVRNFLLCDSQDIVGVETVIRQQSSVWLLGVQRELNELKRTIEMIPAGVRKPRPKEDVATLKLGEFYACFGERAIKTYVWPVWMSAEEARDIALGRSEKRGEVIEVKPMKQNSGLEKAVGEIRSLLNSIDGRVRALEASRLSPSPARDIDRIRLGPDVRYRDPAPGQVDSFVRQCQDVIEEGTQTQAVTIETFEPAQNNGGFQVTLKNAKPGDEDYDMATYDDFKERLLADTDFMRSVVDRALAHLPTNGKVEVEAREVVLNQYQQAEVDRILQSAASLTPFQKDALRFLEARGSRATKGEIFRAIVGRAMGGSDKAKGVEIDSLANAGFLRRDASQYYPNLQKAVSNRLSTFGASEQQVEEVVGQVLLKLK